MGSWMLVWVLSGTAILMPMFVYGVSVHFKTGRPLYVAHGQNLTLEAVLDKKPDDKIDMVTWDRERGRENVRLSGTQGSRISFENEDLLLRITDVTDIDFAVYKVTVTDSNGFQQHDSIEVRKIETPAKASVTRVLECILETHEMHQWDRPTFTWMVDGVQVTDHKALLTDGSKLNITEVKGVNYTCVIHSSLGTQVTNFVIPKESGGFWRALVVLAAVVLLTAGIIFLSKKKSQGTSRSV